MAANVPDLRGLFIKSVNDSYNISDTGGSHVPVVTDDTHSHSSVNSNHIGDVENNNHNHNLSSGQHGYGTIVSTTADQFGIDTSVENGRTDEDDRYDGPVLLANDPISNASMLGSHTHTLNGGYHNHETQGSFYESHDHGDPTDNQHSHDSDESHSHYSDNRPGSSIVVYIMKVDES